MDGLTERLGFLGPGLGLMGMGVPGLVSFFWSRFG